MSLQPRGTGPVTRPFTRFLALLLAVAALPAAAQAGPPGPVAAQAAAPGMPAAAARAGRGPALLSNPAPMYWVLESEGARVHVFGTIHLGSPGLADPPPEVLAAFDGADRLVAEVSSDEMATAGLAMIGPIMRSTLPVGETIGDYLSRHDTAALKRVFGRRWSSIERMEPWLVSLMLQAELLSGSGYDESRGLDRRLFKRAGERPVLGLESLRDQFALLRAGSAREQAAGLSKLLHDFLDGDAERRNRELFSAYESGDAAAMADILEGARLELLEADPSGQAYALLFTNRNRAWAKKIALWLDEGGNWFLFAGAGHFFGDTSVFEELRALGVLR
ncbi:MAG: TraB/GumN family protein [Spirochaetaceae bacterium]|nr:TraB/GumN family protein [Spirochaetaceae bacterium]